MASFPIDAALEAVLFASGSPVTLEKLSEIFNLPMSDIADSAERVANELAETQRGISLICVDGAYQHKTVLRGIRKKSTRAPQNSAAHACITRSARNSFLQSARH